MQLFQYRKSSNRQLFFLTDNLWNTHGSLPLIKLLHQCTNCHKRIVLHMFPLFQQIFQIDSHTFRQLQFLCENFLHRLLRQQYISIPGSIRLFFKKRKQRFHSRIRCKHLRIQQQHFQMIEIRIFAAVFRHLTHSFKEIRHRSLPVGIRSQCMFRSVFIQQIRIGQVELKAFVFPCFHTHHQRKCLIFQFIDTAATQKTQKKHDTERNSDQHNISLSPI